MSERDMRALIALLERRLGVNWADVVEWLRDRNGLDELERKLVTGRIDEVIADVQAAAEKFAADMHQAYVESGQRAAQWLDAKVDDTLVRFDAADKLAVQRARQNTYEQVAGLTQEARETIRQVVVEGVTRGDAPRQTARRLRDSLGLTPQQERAVSNYRAALESGDHTRALGYELRDGRSDRSMRPGMELSQDRIDRLVEAYRRNAVNYRAETIARTESLRAAHEGARDAMTQAIQRGDVDAAQLSTMWHAGPPTVNAREQHRAMDGKSVRVGDDFVLPDGTRMAGPGDPRGGAEHTANCRCTASTAYLEIPEGFSTGGGAVIREGVPARADLEEDAVYVVNPDDVTLRALPGAGSDTQRLQSIADAWDAGRELPPVRLALTEDGELFVEDGRHRLLQARAQGRTVLAQIGRASPGASSGTVRL